MCNVHMLYIIILHTKTALIAHMHLMGCQSRHIESFLRASQHFKVPVHFGSLNRQSYTILQMYIHILANHTLSLSPFQCTCSSTLENLIKTRFHILYPISGSPDPPSDTMRPPRPGYTGKLGRQVPWRGAGSTFCFPHVCTCSSLTAPGLELINITKKQRQRHCEKPAHRLACTAIEEFKYVVPTVPYLISCSIAFCCIFRIPWQGLSLQ